MCQINFTIQASDIDGTLLGGEGRYKLSSSSTWVTFNIADINNAQTPNLTVEGDYDLEIRVQDNNNTYSSWTSVTGFKIGNCSTANEYQIAIADCTMGNPNSVTWTTVYSSISAANLDVGTTLYIDSALTTPYQSNPFSPFNTYRIRTSDLLLYNFSYGITASDGVITSKTDCSNGGGNNGGTGNLVINSSQPTVQGIGTLDFTGGEPNEVLDLDFNLTFYTSNPTINKHIAFSSPVSVGTLNSGITYQAGTVTLDSSGNGTSNYTISEGELSCQVDITSRSSTEPIPTVDGTTIDMPGLTVS